MLKKFLVGAVLLSLFSLFACKKAKQSILEDLMIKLITENVWYMTKFNVGSSSILKDFEGYEFHFNKDNTVRAVKAGQADQVGTWVGSQETSSITSNFPSASYPITKLNGVWLVFNTDLSPKLVDSHRYEGSTELVMRLNAK